MCTLPHNARNGCAQTSLKIFSLRQIEARTKDKLWADDVRQLSHHSSDAAIVLPPNPMTPLSTTAVQGEPVPDESYSGSLEYQRRAPPILASPSSATPAVNR